VWVALAIGNGLYFSFSVFLVPLVDEFHWSRALTAGAQSISTVLQGLLAPVAGILIDRFGPRRVILAGALLLSSASLLGATIQSVGELYFYTGVLGAAGLIGLGPVPMGVLISRWFAERRGRAVGIAFSGMGFGVFVMGPLAQWLIAVMGWRIASAALGMLSLCILAPIVWIGARDPLTDRGEGAPAGARSGVSRAASSGGPDRELRRALAEPAFWALWVANLCTPLAVFPISTHQVAFAID
jgi:MFS family permease